MRFTKLDEYEILINYLLNKNPEINTYISEFEKIKYERERIIMSHPIKSNYIKFKRPYRVNNKSIVGLHFFRDSKFLSDIFRTRMVCIKKDRTIEECHIPNDLECLRKIIKIIEENI